MGGVSAPFNGSAGWFLGDTSDWQSQKKFRKKIDQVETSRSLFVTLIVLLQLRNLFRMKSQIIRIAPTSILLLLAMSLSFVQTISQENSGVRRLTSDVLQFSEIEIQSIVNNPFASVSDFYTHPLAVQSDETAFLDSLVNYTYSSNFDSI